MNLYGGEKVRRGTKFEHRALPKDTPFEDGGFSPSCEKKVQMKQYMLVVTPLSVSRKVKNLYHSGFFGASQ